METLERIHHDESGAAPQLAELPSINDAAAARFAAVVESHPAIVSSRRWCQARIW